MKRIKLLILILLLFLLSFSVTVFLLLDKKENRPSVIVKEKIEEEEVLKKVETPKEIRAVYLTGWSAGTDSMVKSTLKFTKDNDINAIVIDIKDWSGNVFYNTDVAEAEKAERLFIKDVDVFLKKMKDNNLYVIGRIVVFQDPILAKNKPELAIKKKSDEKSAWKDNAGLSWIDPCSKDAWDYNIAIAKDAFKKGFDEINFDYIRFPADGDILDMSFPFYDEAREKSEAITSFFSYLRKNLPNSVISADLFGLATVDKGDLGIGQSIEDAFANFDYVCPMVYPSHYEDNFLGYANPAEYPYEIITYSMSNALARLKSNKDFKAKLRPWLQDFDLGADYGKEEVNKQINAVKDSLEKDYRGFMLWSASNIYTDFEKKQE